ncbi:MAG: hypothetical protein R2849_13675 [Thermomicrobiales bacterium]
MDPRLPRDWGSQYGNDLDVVARGVGVRSLDERGPSGDLPRQLFDRSAGTSIASLQVGLAALISGIRPELTNQQVRDLIEGSCVKLSGYRFVRVPNKKWRWNREVGYGRPQGHVILNNLVEEK